MDHASLIAAIAAILTAIAALFREIRAWRAKRTCKLAANGVRGYEVNDSTERLSPRFSMSGMIRWLRRWRSRDDQHLIKRANSLPADPIDQLRRLVDEAQELDAADERRLYPMRGNRPSSFRRRRPDHR